MYTQLYNIQEKPFLRPKLTSDSDTKYFESFEEDDQIFVISDSNLHDDEFKEF